MNYFNEDYLEITWDENIKCVIMTWKKFVNGEKFRLGLNKGLDLIIEKKSCRWLADLRNMQVLSITDQEWSNENWYPRAVRGGITKMAIVMPSSALATMGVKKIMSKVGEINIETNYLESIASAKQWLRG